MANSFTCVDDFERYAFNNLPKNALDYYRSGADQQITLNENRNAFTRYGIIMNILYADQYDQYCKPHR